MDEPIYQRLPAFIIATVDKFANLPWVGETAGLFGRVQRYDLSAGFFGPSVPGKGRALDRPLPPPDLIIQDELHLISGPLGTLVGLYETAIDALCGGLGGEGGSARPKIVASTATVRRAEKQILGLFGRQHVDIFPPPGPNRRDSFFAETVPADMKSPRTYLGIAAQEQRDAPQVGSLWFDEGGAGNDFQDIYVRLAPSARAHGPRRPLSDATVPSGFPLGICTGRQPWLGPRSKEYCEKPAKLLTRSASNAYFAQTVIRDTVLARSLKAQFETLVDHGALKPVPGL